MPPPPSYPTSSSSKTRVCPPACRRVTLTPPLPPTATPRLCGVFRGERRQSAQAEVTLHPEEASGGAHQQVPEAVHLKTKRRLLTSAGGPQVTFKGADSTLSPPPVHTRTRRHTWLCSAPSLPVADSAASPPPPLIVCPAPRPASRRVYVLEIKKTPEHPANCASMRNSIYLFTPFLHCKASLFCCRTFGD